MERAAADEEVDHVSEVTPDEEAAFLSDALGPVHAEEAQKLNRETEVKVDWENKPINPHNKPMHPSVTEQYFTEGGKEVKAVHDEVGTFWHVEFSPGGELPAELKGKYTTEQDARQAIRRYLAKKAQ